MRRLLVLFILPYLVGCAQGSTGGGASDTAPVIPVTPPGGGGGYTTTTTTTTSTTTSTSTTSSTTTTTLAPVFVALSCAVQGGTNVVCSNANLQQVTALNFWPYLAGGNYQVALAYVANNLGAGQPYTFPNGAKATCVKTYGGLTDCTCISVVFQDKNTHALSAPAQWCGTGVNTSTDFLEYL